MRRLILIEYLSLDGVTQAPGHATEDTDGGFAHGGWSGPQMDDHRRYMREALNTMGAAARPGHLRDLGRLLADVDRRWRRDRADPEQGPQVRRVGHPGRGLLAGDDRGQGRRRGGRRAQAAARQGHRRHGVLAARPDPHVTRARRRIPAHDPSGRRREREATAARPSRAAHAAARRRHDHDQRSSALIKLIFDEPGSELAVELWDRAEILVSSQLVYPEARAALAAATRASRIDESSHAAAVAALEDLYAQPRTIAIDEPLARHAGDLASEHALRGYDAGHLACALHVQGDDILLATWDNALNSAARATGRLIVNDAG